MGLVWPRPGPLPGLVFFLGIIFLLVPVAFAANVFVDVAVQPEEEMLRFAAQWDPRNRPAANCEGGCVYLLGGETGPGLARSDQIWAHRVDAYGWTQKSARLPEPLSGMASVIVGSSIYLFGGFRDPSGAPGSTILRYDIDGDTVSTLTTHLPQPRGGAAAAYAADRAYIFAGNDGSNTLLSVLRFNPQDETIETVGSNYPGIGSAACALTAGSRIIVIGPNGSDTLVLRRFDPASGQMTAYASSVPGFGYQSCSWDGQFVWVFNDQNIYRFDPNEDEVVTMGFTLPKIRQGSVAVTTNDRIYIYGGWMTASDSSTFTGEIWRFEPNAPDPVSSATTTPPPTSTTPPPTLTTPTVTMATSSSPGPTTLTQYVTQNITQNVTGSSSPTAGPPSPGLNFGGAAGIIIGSLAVAGPLGYLGFTMVARRRRRSRPQPAAVQAVAASDVALRVHDLRIERSGKGIVHGVTFDVPKGSLTILLGPSGSGKSTILRAIVGLVPSQGEVAVDGQWMRPGDDASKAKLGYVPQDLQIYTNLGALDNIAYFAAQFGIPQRKAKERGLDLLRSLGLEGMELRAVEKMSGGQQRRVSIAASLVHEPYVVVLDEPTSGLDLSARKALWGVLERLAQERGVAVLATSHFIDDAQHAKHVGLIVAGRLVAHGSPRALIRTLPGEGRCVDIEFEEFRGPDRARLQALLPALQKAGLVERAEYRLHGVRYFSKDPARAARTFPNVLHQQRFKVRSAALEDITLEDVFAYYTGSPGTKP